MIRPVIIVNPILEIRHGFSYYLGTVIMVFKPAATLGRYTFFTALQNTEQSNSTIQTVHFGDPNISKQISETSQLVDLSLENESSS